MPMTQSHLGGFAPDSKWSSAFWADLAERVGSTFLGALLAMMTLAGQTPADWSDAKAVWAVLGVPTVVSLLKGLLANMKDPESGASLLDSPPGPVLEDERGAVDVGTAVLIGILVLLVLVVLGLVHR